MTLKPVRIGLCGLGTVGSGTFNVLTRNAREISARAGTDIIIEQIGTLHDVYLMWSTTRMWTWWWS